LSIYGLGPFLILLLLSCNGSAFAQQLTDPKVKEVFVAINKDITALAGRSEAEATEICGRVVANIMDIDAVVKGASSRISDKMTAKQRADYGAAALRWAIRNCVQRNKDGAGVPMEFVGLREGEGGDRLLATRSSQPAHFVIWRLRGAGKLRAVDLLLDGVSMTLQLRDETNTLLEQHNNDIDQTIAALHR